MEHMVGKGWQDLFEVVLTKARKPSFYNQTYRQVKHFSHKLNFFTRIKEVLRK